MSTYEPPVIHDAPVCLIIRKENRKFVYSDDDVKIRAYAEAQAPGMDIATFLSVHDLAVDELYENNGFIFTRTTDFSKFMGLCIE